MKPRVIDVDTESSDATTAPPSPNSSQGDSTPDEPDDDGPSFKRRSTGPPWSDDELWEDPPVDNSVHGSYYSPLIIEEEDEDEVFTVEEEEEVFTVEEERTRTRSQKKWKQFKARRSNGRVGGWRTTTRKNKKLRYPRRLRDRRRRQALRHKQLARRARMGARRRRPRPCLRGGAYPDEGANLEGGEQVCDFGTYRAIKTTVLIHSSEMNNRFIFSKVTTPRHSLSPGDGGRDGTGDGNARRTRASDRR